VMFKPVLPAERCHPKAGNKNDGGDVHCGELAARASRWPGNCSLSGGRQLNAARLLMSSGSCLWLDSLTTGRKIRRNFMTYAFMLVQAVRYVTGSAAFELRSFVK